MGFEALIGPVVGGLLGGQESERSQTNQNQLDPRIARRLYGEDGNGGLLGSVSDRFNANPSGMNPQIVQGMNRQWGLLTDPSVQAGFQGMRETGRAGMSLPFAGNPFTQPGGYSRAMFGGGQQQPRTGYGSPGVAGPPDPAGQVQPAPQPAGQFGPAPSYNPSQPGLSQARDLYAQIGRTGQNAPTQQELDHWSGTGLQGDQLRQRFLGEAANHPGQGLDQFKQAAQGLLAPRAPFQMPAAPIPQAPAAQQPRTPQQETYDEYLQRLAAGGPY